MKKKEIFFVIPLAVLLLTGIAFVPLNESKVDSFDSITLGRGCDAKKIKDQMTIYSDGRLEYSAIPEMTVPQLSVHQISKLKDALKKSGYFSSAEKYNNRPSICQMIVGDSRALFIAVTNKGETHKVDNITLYYNKKECPDFDLASKINAFAYAVEYMIDTTPLPPDARTKWENTTHCF